MHDDELAKMKETDRMKLLKDKPLCIRLLLDVDPDKIENITSKGGFTWQQRKNLPPGTVHQSLITRIP
jgi:hypothetical protein